MLKLGVNIDHVASLRQLRRGNFPDLVGAAKIVEKTGADSIVVHLREDRRHVQDKDLFDLKKNIKIRLNLEMSIAADIVNICLKLKPNQATLVPEKRLELTTEGGLDVVKNKQKIKKVVIRLQKKGILVSLFIDPIKKQIKAAYETGAEFIELHTGKYAGSKNKLEYKKNLRDLGKATRYAINLGLGVNAGHGLDYQNVKLISRIKGIKELNIGYSIICRSLFVGLGRAVKEILELI
ncbi:MAG: pyridoxine 5'-phosphate synthase [Candidatus Omnitrophota bacterium]